jgi:hypothetical protein
MVVYTGTDTKQVLNQGNYKHKLSQMQREINRYMLISLGVIVFVMIFHSQITNRVWNKNNIKNVEGKMSHYYLLTDPDEDFDYNQFSINAVFSFFLLSNSFIPLNMAVINFLTMYFYTVIVFHDPQFKNAEKSNSEN